jgi:hypothetical protein
MPGLHVSELGRSWNDLVKNIQRRPFDMFLFAFTTPFAVPAACCVEKRKEAQDWTHEWSLQSFPSESNLGETESDRAWRRNVRASIILARTRCLYTWPPRSHQSHLQA